MEAYQLSCPLCESFDVTPFYQGARDFLCCQDCQLVFVPPAYYISHAQEKAEYDLHQNSPEDQGYRRFLSRLLEPLNQKLEPGSYGLDFGSGPGPTLSVMFEEQGHRMEIYDSIYAKDPSRLEQQYDFISASEVVEHLHHPNQDLNRLWACLKPKGHLGIMTKRVRDLQAFARWHYKDDVTHVCFFSTQTFEWLADAWNATLEIIGPDVVIFTKPHAGE